MHPKLEAKRQLAELIVQLRNSVIADELLDGKRPANKTLSDRLQSRRDRLERLKDKWANWQITPRHHRIAAVLGIPKGTVDSTLYYVRKTPALQAVAD